MSRQGQKSAIAKTTVAWVAMAAVALLILLVPGTDAVAQGTTDDPAQVDAGKMVFEGSCAGCHAADGTGVSGLGRPLIGIASQGDRATHIGSITNGKGSMPPFGSRLSAEEIEQAASYVRLTFVEAEAATTTAQPELAVTGINSTDLAVIGGALVVAGAGMVRWSRRQDD